jgi:hypothetical protein
MKLDALITIFTSIAILLGLKLLGLLGILGLMGLFGSSYQVTRNKIRLQTQSNWYNNSEE